VKDKTIVAILASIPILIVAVALLATIYAPQPVAPENTTTTSRETYKPSTTLTPSNLNATGIARFESYSDLLKYIENKLGERKLSQDLMNSIGVSIQPFFAGVERDIMLTVPQATVAPSESAGTSYSQTNIQVSGVDEPDIVKTNGVLLAACSDNRVFLINPVNDEVSYVIRYDDPYRAVNGLFLTNQYLVVFTGSVVYKPLSIMIEDGLAVSYPSGVTNTTIFIYDVSNPSKPVEVYRINTFGGVLGARLYNNTLYVVTQLNVVSPIIPLVNGMPIPLPNILVVSDQPDHYIVFNILDLGSMNHTAYAFLLNPSNWFYMSYSRIYLGSYESMSYIDVQKKGLETLAKYMPQNISVQVLDQISRNEISLAIDTVREYFRGKDMSYIETIMANVKKELSNNIYVDKTVFHVSNTMA